MNKIPNPTIVLSTKFKIKYVKKLQDDEDNNLYGQIDPDITEIKLLSTINKIVQEKTWMHEVLHGVFKEINMQISENNLDTLANVLYDTFTRNKIDFSQ